MKKQLIAAFSLLTIFGVSGVNAQQAQNQTKKISVDGKERQYMTVAAPSTKTKESPVVFLFHGRSGTMQGAKDKFGLYNKWKDAIIVVPQGLNVAFPPLAKGAGWQRPTKETPGPDAAFFDKIMETLKADGYKIDPKRIYAIGQLDGSSMILGLMTVKPELFAAVAMNNIPEKDASFLGELSQPTPIYLAATQKNKMVPFDGQAQYRDKFIELNKCGKEGTAVGEMGMIYKSPEGNDVVTFYGIGDDPGYPVPAIAETVKFFKEHPKK